MVQPDLVLGALSAPRSILLVTRSGSRRDWHKKFWRNIGEVVDIRAKRPGASVISVSLGSELKEDLVEVLGLLCDENCFPGREAREQLEEWIATLQPGVASVREELAELMEVAIEAAPRPVRSVLESVQADLERGARARSRRWGGVSAWMQARDARALAASETWSTQPSVRRGLAKLLVLGEPQEVLAAVSGQGSPDAELGGAMGQFGWAKKTIGGWRVSDDELSGVIKGFDRDYLSEVMAGSLTDELRAICADVSSTEWLRASGGFLGDNANRLGDVTYITQQLGAAIDDPSLGAIKAAVPPGLVGNWLFRLLMALIKVETGLKQGFGYEQLIGDVRQIARAGTVPSELRSLGVSLVQLRKAGNTDSLRRRLVDWVSGLRDTRMEEWEVILVAMVLAGRLRAVAVPKLQSAAKEVPEFLRRTTYEDRIAPYRYFEPLRVMIEGVLRRCRLDAEYIPRHPTLVSEGSESTRGPGTTPVLGLGGTLIHWKSAHGAANTGHKTKELCGRAFALRYRLAGSKRQPNPTDGVERLCLVLDGDFTPAQVRSLITSGWDLVVGPYQLELLVDVLEGTA